MFTLHPPGFLQSFAASPATRPGCSCTRLSEYTGDRDAALGVPYSVLSGVRDLSIPPRYEPSPHEFELGRNSINVHWFSPKSSSDDPLASSSIRRPSRSRKWVYRLSTRHNPFGHISLPCFAWTFKLTQFIPGLHSTNHLDHTILSGCFRSHAMNASVLTTSGDDLRRLIHSHGKPTSPPSH